MKNADHILRLRTFGPVRELFPSFIINYILHVDLNHDDRTEEKEQFGKEIRKTRPQVISRDVMLA